MDVPPLVLCLCCCSMRCNLAAPTLASNRTVEYLDSDFKFYFVLWFELVNLAVKLNVYFKCSSWSYANLVGIRSFGTNKIEYGFELHHGFL